MVPATARPPPARAPGGVTGTGGWRPQASHTTGGTRQSGAVRGREAPSQLGGSTGKLPVRLPVTRYLSGPVWSALVKLIVIRHGADAAAQCGPQGHRPVPPIGTGTPPGKNYPVCCIFITGSTDGLGRAAAGVLMGVGHDVVLHARTRERAAALSDLAPDAAGVVIGDLSSAAET
jgi:hypothetical protein